MDELVLCLKHNQMTQSYIMWLVGISYSILHHSWPLGTYGFDGIEHIGHVFSLQTVMAHHEGTKCSSSSHTITKLDNRVTCYVIVWFLIGCSTRAHYTASDKDLVCQFSGNIHAVIILFITSFGTKYIKLNLVLYE